MFQNQIFSPSLFYTHTFTDLRFLLKNGPIWPHGLLFPQVIIHLKLSAATSFYKGQIFLAIVPISHSFMQTGEPAASGLNDHQGLPCLPLEVHDSLTLESISQRSYPL